MPSIIKEFLEFIWPNEGLYCISIPFPTRGYDHKVFKSIDLAVKYAESIKTQNCFMPICSLRKREVWNPNKQNKDGNKGGFEIKSQDNVKLLKTFILDIDSGDGKPYTDKKEALEALKKFISITGLPVPTVVDSGGGLHVYFVLTKPIDPQAWKEQANKLKALAKHFKLDVDNSRTSDSSSLLRVVGTYNLKKDSPRPVRFLKKSDPVEYVDFVGALERVLKANDISVKAFQAPTDLISKVFNDKQSNVSEFPPANGEIVVKKCLQMQHCLELEGDVGEPLWRACLSISRLFETPISHELSSGHPRYSFEKTEAKVMGLAGSGPFKCTTFDEANPELCDHCEYWGKITSPIVIGSSRPIEELPPPSKDEPQETAPYEHPEDFETETLTLPDGQVVELPNPPVPYKRTENGIVITMYDSEDMEEHEFVYQYDIYPFEIVADKRMDGVYSTKIMIKLPFGEEKVIQLNFSTFADQRAFNKTLADAGVLPRTDAESSNLLSYMKSYINEIQKLIRPMKTYPQLGWGQDQASFVLPDKCIFETGEHEESGVTKALTQHVKSFRKRGTLEEWRKIIDIYTKPGYEPYAFGHLVGYASLLLAFTNYEGAIVNMMGDSGSGKSTVLFTINSIFGHPKEPTLLHHDKYLAKIDRLGVFNSICVTYDEITNITPEELSDLCYSVTQGRGRHRLSQSAEMKENNTTWKLILACSSNASLMSKLSTLKHDASAESLRTFEYLINTSRIMTKSESEEAFFKLSDNYGHAGEIFINYVIHNKDRVRHLIEKMTQDFDLVAQVPTNERYWSAIVACVMAGGQIAKSQGLCNFDMDKIFQWAVEQVRVMRGVVKENIKEPRALLAEFLNEHVANTIVIVGREAKSERVSVEAKGALIVRTELDKGLAYISRSHIKQWLIKGGSDYQGVRRALKESKVVLNDNCNKTLSMGSEVSKTGQITTWLVNLNHPEMVGNVLVPVDKEVNLHRTAENILQLQKQESA